MRVKVALPTSKPLRRGAFLGSADGQNTWVHFKYERLPMFCHFCGIMGHDLKNCAQHYASRKNGVEKACQYGEWLKATNGQFRSLPKETPTNSKQTNNETVSQGLGGQGAAVVVVSEKQMEAPMERKSHANDDNAKKGSMESVIFGYKHSWTDFKFYSNSNYHTHCSRGRHVN